MDASFLSSLNEAIANRRAVATVTNLGDGAKRLVSGDDTLSEPLGSEVNRRLRSGKSGIISIDGVEYFIRVHAPPPRLVIIGAVHISQALAPMAKACEIDVRVIDPRTAFATRERFTGIELKAEWPEDALKEAPLDAYTALVAVTHDPKIDDFAIRASLEAGCFYVGALGSRKTHAKRRDRLLEQGISTVRLDMIDAPIGMDIGAATPAEIAVAILARIIENLRKSPAALEAAA